MEDKDKEKQDEQQVTQAKTLEEIKRQKEIEAWDQKVIMKNEFYDLD